MGKSEELVIARIDTPRNAAVVILLHARVGSNSRAADLAERMMKNLDKTFNKILNIDVVQKSVAEIDDYEELYPFVYDRILAEVQDGNEVFVDISPMSQTVAFAFTTAADSLAIEYLDIRNSIQTYYVSPGENLVLDMIDELEQEREFLSNWVMMSDNPEIEIKKRLSVTDS